MAFSSRWIEPKGADVALKLILERKPVNWQRIGSKLGAENKPLQSRFAKMIARRKIKNGIRNLLDCSAYYPKTSLKM